MKMEIGLILPQKFLLTIQENIKNMVSGLFLFTQPPVLQGSPKTPYIWDDRCTAEDAAEAIKKIYNLDPDKRKKLGLKGREWAMSEEAGFTAEKMGNRIIEAINELFEVWEPREKFEIINSKDIKKKILTHNLVY